MTPREATYPVRPALEFPRRLSWRRARSPIVIQLKHTFPDTSVSELTYAYAFFANALLEEQLVRLEARLPFARELLGSFLPSSFSTPSPRSGFSSAITSS